MIYLALVLGRYHGWGICGRYLTREFAKRDEVRLITDPFDIDLIGDVIEFHELNHILIHREQLDTAIRAGGLLDGPMLLGIPDVQFRSHRSGLRGTFNVGYVFFEASVLSPEWIENARRFYDRIVTGSSWCTKILTDHGIPEVATAIQGVDTEIFHPVENAGRHRRALADKFIVFSGGKFEFRKSHDIVIRAYKVLQDRHRDVMLVTAWFNGWQETADTMHFSPYIRYPGWTGPHTRQVSRVLVENGIDVDRVVICPLQSNLQMAHLYHNTDLGIFPNRCEGGSNLVLMEYMACGKPVLATNSTGHADIVNATNALIIGSKKNAVYHDGSMPSTRWPEPDLDETIEKLEWAYQNRDRLAGLGEKAAADLKRRTWDKTAEVMRNIIHERNPNSLQPPRLSSVAQSPGTNLA